MENQERKKINILAMVGKTRLMLVAVVAVIVVVAAVIILCLLAGKDEPEPEIITVSSLEKIINISELSTFTSVYNGVAEVMNEKKNEEVDYYVAYEAWIDAGIDIEKIVITVDGETKTITMTLPDVYITERTVEITSLDFIFINKKADTATVSQEAYKACEEDVKEESEKQTAILELARKNAEKILTALVNPIIEQLDAEYTLEIN